MLSNDTEILLSINGQLVTITSELNGVKNELSDLKERTGKLESQTREMYYEQIRMKEQLEMLKWTVGIGFTVLAIIISFAAFFTPLLLAILKRSDTPSVPPVNSPSVNNPAREIPESKSA